jgi:hypothetical protein
MSPSGDRIGEVGVSSCECVSEWWRRTTRYRVILLPQPEYAELTAHNVGRQQRKFWIVILAGGQWLMAIAALAE